MIVRTKQLGEEVTLVVGKLQNDKIYIESDSRITDPNIAKASPLCGLMKTLILHPFICMSFAGQVVYAEDALKEYFDNKIDDDLESLLSILQTITKASGGQTDFAVASVLNNVPKLFKVSNGRIDRDIMNFWLGDIDGFEYYQRCFHEIDKTISEQDRMRSAFNQVIQNESITTIGDYHFGTYLDFQIAPPHAVFLHKLKVEIQVTQPQEIKIKEAGKFEPIPLGTVAGGSHGLSYLNTVSPDFHGVAIHYTHGNFGILFCPQLSFKGIILKHLSGLEFVLKIKEKYNIPLQGFIKRSATAIQLIDTRFPIKDSN